MRTNAPIEAQVSRIEVGGGTKEMRGKEGATPVQDLVVFKGRPIKVAEGRVTGQRGFDLQVRIIERGSVSPRVLLVVCL